jgi:hypothetical protein
LLIAGIKGRDSLISKHQQSKVELSVIQAEIEMLETRIKNYTIKAIELDLTRANEVLTGYRTDLQNLKKEQNTLIEEQTKTKRIDDLDDPAIVQRFVEMKQKYGTNNAHVLIKLALIERQKQVCENLKNELLRANQ